MKSRFLIVIFLLLSAEAGAESWEMVSRGSELRFNASNEGQPLPGSFDDFSVTLVMEPGNLKGSALHVLVDIASIRLAGDDMREEALKSEWFFIDRFSAARFDSEHIQQTGEHNYLAIGNLSLKGVKEPFDISFSLDKKGTIKVMTGEFAIDRTRFGVGTGEWSEGDVIGREVEVSFRVYLRPLGR